MNEILATKDGGVLTLTLNRPAKMNALTRGMYGSLAEHLREATGDFSIRCVLIASEGAHFTAGNDINDFIESSGRVTESEGFDFLTQLRDFPKPIVAVVQGSAIGIGTTLLLHCDVVVADPSASFSMPFVSLGLVPEAGSSFLFPQLVGYQRASHIFLTGESFGAQEAKEMGLATVVAEDALERVHLGQMGNRGAGVCVGKPQPVADAKAGVAVQRQAEGMAEQLGLHHGAQGLVLGFHGRQ